MRSIDVTGHVTNITTRQVQKEDGSSITVTTLAMAVTDRVKVNGEWDNYHVCLRPRLTAWGQVAETWAKNYSEGHAVEVSGLIREEEYTKQDGSKGKSTIIEGAGGSAPTVRWVPKLREPREARQQAMAQPAPPAFVPHDDEPPF